MVLWKLIIKYLKKRVMSRYITSPYEIGTVEHWIWFFKCWNGNYKGVYYNVNDRYLPLETDYVPLTKKTVTNSYKEETQDSFIGSLEIGIDTLGYILYKNKALIKILSCYDILARHNLIEVLTVLEQLEFFIENKEKYQVVKHYYKDNKYVYYADII